MVRHFPVLHFPDHAISCEVVHHFPVLHFQVVHFQSPVLFPDAYFMFIFLQLLTSVYDLWFWCFSLSFPFSFFQHLRLSFVVFTNKEMSNPKPATKPHNKSKRRISLRTAARQCRSQ